MSHVATIWGNREQDTCCPIQPLRQQTQLLPFHRGSRLSPRRTTSYGPFEYLLQPEYEFLCADRPPGTFRSPEFLECRFMILFEQFGEIGHPLEYRSDTYE